MQAISIENKLRSLEHRVEELHCLCQEIDPFSKLDAERLKQLEKLGITPTDDPMVLTNQLLTLLEGAIEELEQIQKQTLRQ